MFNGQCAIQNLKLPQFTIGFRKGLIQIWIWPSWNTKAFHICYVIVFLKTKEFAYYHIKILFCVKTSKFHVAKMKLILATKHVLSIAE